MSGLFQTTERERLQEELEEAKDKARRRSIGNIKFIGELFKLKMLTEAIMHDCVVKLLKNHDEESLECLCRLLTTIGKDLDFEKAKVRQLPASSFSRCWIFQFVFSGALAAVSLSFPIDKSKSIANVVSFAHAKTK